MHMLMHMKSGDNYDNGNHFYKRRNPEAHSLSDAVSDTIWQVLEHDEKKADVG